MLCSVGLSSMLRWELSVPFADGYFHVRQVTSKTIEAGPVLRLIAEREACFRECSILDLQKGHIRTTPSWCRFKPYLPDGYCKKKRQDEHRKTHTKDCVDLLRRHMRANTKDPGSPENECPLGSAPCRYYATAPSFTRFTKEVLVAYPLWCETEREMNKMVEK